MDITIFMIAFSIGLILGLFLGFFSKGYYDLKGSMKNEKK